MADEADEADEHGSMRAFGVDLRALVSSKRSDGGPRAERSETLEVPSPASDERLEQLIERHGVDGGVAAYARHVLRAGFDAPFDPMDPDVRETS